MLLGGAALPVPAGPAKPGLDPGHHRTAGGRVDHDLVQVVVVVRLHRGVKPGRTGRGADRAGRVAPVVQVTAAPAPRHRRR